MATTKSNEILKVRKRYCVRGGGGGVKREWCVFSSRCVNIYTSARNCTHARMNSAHTFRDIPAYSLLLSLFLSQLMHALALDMTLSHAALCELL